MGYEINSNIYIAAKRLEARDVFDQEIYIVDAGTELDSIWASWIIVDEEDRVAFDSLTPQECLNKKVELGYLTVKA